MKTKYDKQIATYDISEGIFRILEITSGKYDQFSRTKFVEPHRRNFFSFFLIKTGRIRHSIDFRNYSCETGDIFFIAPQEIYLVDTATDFGGISINCKMELLSPDEKTLPIIQNLCHINKLSFDEQQYKYLSDLMGKMLLEFNTKEIFSQKILRSYFSTMLFYLSRLYHQQNQIPETKKEATSIIEKFRSLIDIHWKELLQLTDYAGLLHISAGHLNHIAKQYTGKKAIEMIHERKLIEAKRLLLYSNCPIKEISYQSGFQDPAYFNRFFKKFNGITPQAFRKEIREKYNTLF